MSAFSVVEALDDGVVIATAFATHAASDAARFKYILAVIAHELHTAVRVSDIVMKHLQCDVA